MAKKRRDTVLVLRTCKFDMSSYGGFLWPRSGFVEAPDWSPEPVCGRGLHGLLWGEGDANWSSDANWLVCRVEAGAVVDLCGKVKFQRGEVVYCGDGVEAAKYVIANGGEGRRVVRGTATAGDGGTATAGYGGAIAIWHWNGKLYKLRVAQVKDQNGDGDLLALVKYKLDESGQFERVREEGEMPR